LLELSKKDGFTIVLAVSSFDSFVLLQVCRHYFDYIYGELLHIR
jgi:hypothetical protein